MAKTLKSIAEGLEMFHRLSPIDRRRVATHLSKSPAGLLAAKELLARLPSEILKNKMPSVFLSHSHRDKPFVRALARRLEPYRIRVWIDEAELNVGDSLIQKLSEAIDKIDLVLAVISENSAKSSWVKEELHLAMTDQVQGRRVKVLPLLKDATPLPRFLRGRIYGDFTTPYRRKRNLESLVQSIYAQVSGAANPAWHQR